MKIQPDPHYPKIITFVTGTGFQVVFALLALCLIIFYNAAYFIYVPVTGVWLDFDPQTPNSAIIYSLNPGGPGEKAGLQVGDKIVSIDGRAITNLNIPMHQPKQAGDTEVYEIQRDHQDLTINLVVGSYADHPDYLANIVPIELLSFLFYFLGLILLFFSPSSDIRTRLVANVWVLAGIAIAATGPGYMSGTWLAPVVAMLTFAASIFISIAAHLYFPVPTFSTRTRNIILWALFGISVALTGAYLVQQLYLAIHNQYPPTSVTAQAINWPFYLSWLVIFSLLLKNRFFIKDKEIKRQTGILFLGTLLGFLPLLLFSELPQLIFGRDSEFILLPSNISILALNFVPIAYGYVIYQRKLLKIDFIINRSLVLFFLIIAILFTSITILGLVSNAVNLPSQVAIAGGFLCVLVALPSATLRKRIQIQVDRTLYGGYYDYTSVTSDLSSRLAQTIDRPALISVLIDELPGKMKIEQSALLLLAGNHLELQRCDGDGFTISPADEICEILATAHKPVRAQDLWNRAGSEPAEPWKYFEWGQLFVPFVHRDTLYGVLILGDRSIGEFYSNQDLQIIETVGQQAAMSISNIALVEDLRGLAQQLVRSDEEQRKKVAQDLHDSVLQTLFFIKQRIPSSDPEAVSVLDRITTILRQTIKAQRPSLLDQGLILALQDLIGDMRQLVDDEIAILWHNCLEEELALSDEKATSIYRIVQESLFNVLKHSQADQVIVTAKKDLGFLEFRIEDDGIGMPEKSEAQMGYHYGILSMKERAAMIGADLVIVSEPEKGTSVTVKLKIE